MLFRLKEVSKAYCIVLYCIVLYCPLGVSFFTYHQYNKEEENDNEMLQIKETMA